MPSSTAWCNCCLCWQKRWCWWCPLIGGHHHHLAPGDTIEWEKDEWRALGALVRIENKTE